MSNDSIFLTRLILRYCSHRPEPKEKVHNCHCPFLCRSSTLFAAASGMDGGCKDTLIIFAYFVRLWFF